MTKVSIDSDVPHEWGPGEQIPDDVDHVHEVDTGMNWYRLYAREYPEGMDGPPGPREPTDLWQTEVGPRHLTAMRVREGMLLGDQIWLGRKIEAESSDG